jgi:hypothetical protein
MNWRLSNRFKPQDFSEIKLRGINKVQMLRASKMGDGKMGYDITLMGVLY